MRRAFWIVVIGLLVATRVPATPQYFSIDNVNLALSLESFNPLNHQPQPPGYPFFVAFARLINFVVRDAWWTFVIVALISSALCLPLIRALGERMFSSAAGQSATLLLVVSPVFWHAALAGPLRGFLALFALLTAYCAWRAWTGEARWVLGGALALGVGGGFRPDLLPLLFPLWLISAAVGTRSLKTIIGGVAILGAVTLAWVGALVIAVGGIQPLIELNAVYLARESERGGSWLFGATGTLARRQFGRLVIWNALGVIGWIWAAPFAFRKLESDQSRQNVNRLLFIAAWIVPGLILQALIHVEDPGHTLFSLPALCLLGGWTIGKLFDTRADAAQPGFSGAVLGIAMAVNVMLFLNFVAVPPKDAPTGGWRSLKNAAIYGSFESSLSQIRWLDDLADTTMKELKQLAPTDRPWIIVSTEDANRQDWFTNWRIVRYYAPNADIWIARDTHDVAIRFRRDRALETREPAEKNELVRIPTPRGGRILWLIESGGAMYRALQTTPHLGARERLLFTDIPNDAQAFTAWNYEFVPSSN